MSSQKRFGKIGMFGAGLFFLNLLVEYRYGLFPPGTGWLYVVNQLLFFVAMVCMLWLLVGLWQHKISGDRWYGRFPLGLFVLGWALTTLANPISMITGNDEIILYPIGGMGMLLGGLLTGIVTAISGHWRGWQRFAILFLSLVNPVSMIIRGTVEPNLLVESIWMAGWFLVGYALYQGTNDASHISHSKGELA